MRGASAGLIALLNSATEFVVCDLLTISLPYSGLILRYTSADVDIKVLSRFDNVVRTFDSKGPPFTRSETRIVRGLEVSTMALNIHCRQGLDIFPGDQPSSWPTAAVNGALDGATVCLEKLIAPSFADTSNGTLIQFLGRVGTAKPSRNMVELEVRAAIDSLSGQFPRNVYQPTCLHTFLDTGCALSRPTVETVVSILSGSTAKILNVTLAGATGLYDLGTTRFASGTNYRIRSTIRTFTAGSPATIELVKALPLVPDPGDSLVVTQGCDKTLATCRTKFSNDVHFRGMPFVPKSEVAR